MNLIKRFKTTYQNKIISFPSYYQRCMLSACQMNRNIELNIYEIEEMFNRKEYDKLEEIFYNPNTHFNCNDLKNLVEYIKHHEKTLHDNEFSRICRMISSHMRYTIEYKDCKYCARYYTIFMDVDRSFDF